MKKSKLSIIIISVIVILLGIVIYFCFNKQSANISNNIIIDTDVDIDDSDEEIDWTEYDEKDITLTKSLNITNGGIYNLSGSIDNGLITINTDENVKIILNNVTITNQNGPAIYVENAKTVIISTKENSTNTLNDSENYTGFDEDVIGTIYSKDDLVLEGEGNLIINGNNEDAIVCKDDLKINSGNYTIKAVDDGIRGKDSVYILDGNFDITSGGDAIKSSNDSDTQKGYIKILNGEFNIEATLDGLQAETKVLIENGTFNITTGGGASNSSDKEAWGMWGSGDENSDSAKGIKAGTNIVIDGGTYTINSSDDSLHSNSQIGINAGTFNITSGDDGIHADESLQISGGDIEILKSYEGLEALNIIINDGKVSIVASDDGINAAGGNDESALNRPGNPNSSSSNGKLTINDGQIYINASGDGLDANGSIYINGGNITVDGPTNDGNGPMDYDGECLVNGGTLIAAGSSGMAQGISSNSSQYGVLINFTSSKSAGVTVSIKDSTGNEVIKYTPSKTFSSILFTSNTLDKGTYTIYIDDEEYQTVEISNISTTLGSKQTNSMGGNPGQRRR